MIPEISEVSSARGVTYSSMPVPVKISPFGLMAEGATGSVPSS